LNELGTDAKALDTPQPISAQKAQLRLHMEARLEALEKTLAGIEQVSDRGRSLTSSIQTARSYLRAG
jgi:hypothetical protein